MMVQDKGGMIGSPPVREALDMGEELRPSEEMHCIPS